MQLNQLRATPGRKYKKYVGRGGKRGKTSGRGGKGQTARAGHKGRPELRDLIKKIPKLRGHGKNRSRTVDDSRVRVFAVNVGDIDARFESDAKVNPAALVKADLVPSKGGKVPRVKILGTGEISKKVSIEGCTVSMSAREKIEKVGGSIL